jgi:hypothetical protein
MIINDSNKLSYILSFKSVSYILSFKSVSYILRFSLYAKFFINPLFMLINLKIISGTESSFYIQIDDSKTIKDLREIISNKIKSRNFFIRRENRNLHDSLDLSTYEFSKNDCIELMYYN